MTRAEKAQTIDELARKLREANGAVLLDYRGLNVAGITALRRRLGGENVEFTVAKNTLLRIAAERADVSVAPELLIGPTAVAFGYGEETAPARLLTEFVRRNRVVSVKGGIIGGRSVNASDIERVSELPSRPVLLATMLGGFQSPMTTTLRALQAPARKLAGLLQALAEKKQAAEAA